MIFSPKHLYFVSKILTGALVLVFFVQQGIALIPRIARAEDTATDTQPIVVESSTIDSIDTTIPDISDTIVPSSAAAEDQPIDTKIDTTTDSTTDIQNVSILNTSQANHSDNGDHDDGHNNDNRNDTHGDDHSGDDDNNHDHDDRGTIKTTNIDCAAPKINGYSTGETVYVRATDFSRNKAYSWNIKQAGTSLTIATGTQMTDSHGKACFSAHTVLQGENGNYIVTFGSYHHSDTDTYCVTEIVADPTNTPPTITLIGANPFNLLIGDIFTDPGATSTDAEDGPLIPVVTGGPVVTSATSTFTLAYRVTDSGGLSASTTRTVIVSATSSDAGSGSTGTTTTATTTATTTPDTGGSSNGGSPSGGSGIAVFGGGGGGGGGTGGFGNSGTLLALANSASTTLTFNICPLITTYMRLGGNNDRGDVLRLQIFLRSSEHLDVDVTGIFDEKTDAAVRVFQVKYLSEVMGPWEATQSSGYVYITTTKKINQLACAAPIILNASELAIIQAYIQNLHNAASSPNAPGESSGIENGTNTSTTSPLIGENSNGNTENTGAAINAPILQRLWIFLRNLFHR